jgi:hypothetical protein
MRCSDNELEALEELIQENIEWLETTEGEEVEAISIENLETILTRFFSRTITITLK